VRSQVNVKKKAMELMLEPLLLTITSLRELVKSHAEIANEISDLGETIGLIEVAIRPLFRSSIDDPHLRDILGALQQSMMKAKSALERMVDASSPTITQRLMAWLRSNNDLAELKGHQDKLKTLCPILSLAISTSQQNNRLPASAGADLGFDALRLIQNEEAKKFWAHHFGPKTFKVTWSQFRAAFEHEFKDQRSADIGLLRQQLDRNNDGDVDIYELANFTGTLNLLDSFKQLLLHQQTQRSKRLAPESKTHRQTDQSKEPNSKRPKSDPPKPLMGPPLASLAKAKFALAADVHHVPREEEDSQDNRYAYKLLLFAREEIFQMEGCQAIKAIYQPWHPEEPFVLGRMMMEQLPPDLLVRISRAHFEIHCSLFRSSNEPTECRQFWMVDTSGNGTFINGKRLTKGKKMLLHRGDQIGIVTDKDRLLVEMGYTFQPINIQGSQERSSLSYCSPPSATSLSSFQPSGSSFAPMSPLDFAVPHGSSPSISLDEAENFPCTPPKTIPTIVVTPPPSPSKENTEDGTAIIYPCWCS